MLVMAVGCERDSRSGGEQGEVVFSVETISKTEILNVSTRVGQTPTYRLTIFKGTSQVATYEDYTKIERLSLVAGTYKFVVESGDAALTAIEAPYYRGETTVNVRAGQSAAVNIKAKLANVRVSATVSQIIIDNFTDYSLTINNVKLTKSDIIAGRSLYVSVQNKSFVWYLHLINSQGTTSDFYRTQDNVEPCSHYKFNFDIDNTAAEDDGQFILDLQVDTWVDHIEEDININLEKKDPPLLSPAGAPILSEQVVVNEITRQANFLINIYTAAGLKSVKIRQSNDWLTAQGVPAVFEIGKVDAATTSKINALGITWDGITPNVPSSILDFTTLAKTAPLGEYRIYVTVQDNADQITEGVVNFIVLPDQDHITKGVVNGAKYAELNGVWCTRLVPDGLTFQYKIEGSSAWSAVPTSEIVKDEATKKFSARIINLTPTTTYIFRTYSPAAGEKQGQEVKFTTEDAPEIPNLSFDEGYWSGSYWYPNASGGNSYWATGNDGVVAGPVSMSANNRHEEQDVIKGKAVRLTSVRITFGLSPVKFAGGSIFTGDYKTNMSNPVSSVKFGRAYTGRPLGLKGWYKYKPQIINNNKNGIPNVNGTMDRCHIYISLEDWGGASSRPDSPTIIGYGELQSDQEVKNWTQFSFPIKYNDPVRKPTHVVMTATASYLGGNFCGGDGSEMLIDEFELIWQ